MAKELNDWQPYSRAGQTRLFKTSMALMRLFFRRYGRLQVRGIENVPASGGAILAANHVSYLDPMIIGSMFDEIRPLWGIAKSELWKVGPIGSYLNQCRAIPIRRGTADRVALRFGIERLKAGDLLLIFPEGERSKSGEMLPPEPGIALLAQRAGVPIVPVAIQGTFKMLPRGRIYLRRAPLTVTFGPPVQFSSDTPRDEIAARVMRAIQELLQR